MVMLGDWYVDKDNILWSVYMCSSTHVRLAHSNTALNLLNGFAKDDKVMTIEEFTKLKVNHD